MSINYQRVLGALIIMLVLSGIAYASVQSPDDTFYSDQVTRQTDIAHMLDAITKYTVQNGDEWLQEFSGEGKEICASEYCGINFVHLPSDLSDSFLGGSVPHDPLVPPGIPGSGYILTYNGETDVLEIHAPYSVRPHHADDVLLKVSVGGIYEQTYSNSNEEDIGVDE